MQQTHHQSSSEQATTTYLRICLLSRGLSLGVEAQVLLGHRDTPPRDLAVQAWLCGLDSIPSLSRVQENPEPRWGEEGRVPRVWGGGAPHPAPRPHPIVPEPRAASLGP